MSRRVAPSPRWSGLFALVLSALSACGDGTAPVDSTRTLAIAGGNGQSATVGTAVAVAPSVRVTNSSGTGVAGVAVTFAVASGGGAVGGGAAVTDASGVASVASWTLGTTAGAQTLTASTLGAPAVTITATAIAGAAASATASAGDGQTAAVRASVAVPPAVRVVDAFGNVKAGVAVTFAVTAGGGSITGASATTNGSGVASSGAWTLGTTGGVNRVTATVDGVTTPVTFTATATEVVLQPGQDTTFTAGTIQLTRFVIPAGRTVTVTGALTINADSTVTIAGTLRGDCHALTINGERTLAVSGLITNECTTQPESPPNLTVVAKGGYDLSGASLRSTGDVSITNDPTLQDSDFTGSGPAATRASQTQGGGACIAGSLSAPQAPSGTAGTTGGNGRHGRTWTLRCRGDLTVGGTIAGQDAGDGGAGSASSAASPSATGGRGGDGGRLRVLATGFVFLGPASTLRSGRGGDGGAATATALESDAGTRAPSATATGGNGGEPGEIEVRGRAGIQVSASAVLEVGRGGHGGDATATGARGKDATATVAAQLGGSATARAGSGGNVAVGKLNSSGAVAGAPTVAGASAGRGGTSTATAGLGGSSTVEAQPNGAAGGNLVAEAGAGGSANARNLAATRIGSGGNGGAARFFGGNGGDGWNDCLATPKAGGVGGAGGSATGGDGAGGTGASNGTDGGVTYTNATSGGRGGNGQPAGAGGAAGANTVQVRGGPAVHVGRTFQAGAPGTPCAPPTTGTVTFQVQGLTVTPSVLGVIKQGSTIVGEVSTAGSPFVLEAGEYTFEGTVVDPTGFHVTVTDCDAVEGTTPAESPVPGICRFEIEAGQFVSLLIVWQALNGQLIGGAIGLPPAFTALMTVAACISQSSCSGAGPAIGFPVDFFLAAGLIRIALMSTEGMNGFLLDQYAPVVATFFRTIVAGTILGFNASYYLASRRVRNSASTAVQSDQHGHSPFIALQQLLFLQMALTFSAPSAEDGLVADQLPVPITIEGPAPFVSMTGVMHPDRTVTASGSGTVAGFPNVPVTFTGTLSESGALSGQYRMGQDTAPTGLPGGSIVYTITGVPVMPASSVARPAGR